MDYNQRLKENTDLPDRFFPLNVFSVVHNDEMILHIHWHEHIEILLVTQGRARFYLGDRGYECTAGDILLVNSGLLHSGYAIDGTVAGYKAVVFERGMLGSASADPAHARYVQPFLDGRRLLPEKIGAHDDGYGAVRSVLDLLLCEFEEKREGYELAVRSALSLFLLAVRRAYPDAASPRLGGLDRILGSDRFKTLLTHIDQNYAEHITIGEAAGIVSLSPAHFCKTFKRLTGRTFVDFLSLYRVDRAAGLLRSTDLPVSEVAAQTGFCNINYFDKVFRKLKGCPPLQYRKMGQL